MVLEILQHLLFLFGPLELVMRLNNLKKGSPHSPSQETNLFKVAMQPVSF
jgi:hypothetical protein